MALQTFTVRQALEGADARLTALQTNPILDSAQRALVGELLNVNTLALNALRPDNTIAAGQRTARAQAIEDKVRALGTVEAAHGAQVGIDAFYTALDQSMDSAGAIRLGQPTFISDIAVG